MSKSRTRSVKTAQLGMREMNITVDGADGVPNALGFDRFGVSSIVDNGVGDYTLNFSEAFERPPIGYCQAITAGALFEISAVTASSITVLCKNSAGAPLDADFYLRVLGSEFSYDI